MTRPLSHTPVSRRIAHGLAHGSARVLLAASMLAPAAAFAGQPDAPSSEANPQPLTKVEIVSMLEAKGYTRINDVEFKDGMWQADARSADGERLDLSIDASSGKVYPEKLVANLSEDDVKAKLTAAGYLDVHDLDFENGLWTAEAEIGKGLDVELTLDPKTGEILGREKD